MPMTRTTITRWIVAAFGCTIGATALVYVPGAPLFSFGEAAFLAFAAGGILIGPPGSRFRLLGYLFLVTSVGEGIVLVELIRQSVAATDGSGPSIVNYIVVGGLGLLSYLVGWTILKRSSSHPSSDEVVRAQGPSAE